MNHFLTRWLFLNFFILVLGFSTVKAQEIKHSFSPEALEVFAKIYLETNAIENNLDVEIISLLQQHNVSYGRYRDILRQNTDGKEKSSYSENEKTFFDAVQKKNQEIAAKILKFESEKCKELSLDTKTYFEIKEEFTNSPKFQTAIYPYFEKVMENDPKD